MTIITFEDDQMVPQDTFNFISQNGGGTVTTNTLQKQTIPDLEALLADLSSTLSQDINSQPVMDIVPFGESYRVLEQPFCLQDDLTFYEEMPQDQKPKLADLQKQMMSLPLAEMNVPLNSPAVHNTITVTAMPVVAAATHDSEMDAARREVDNVCAQLEIPADPYAWTMDEVTKWARWTLEQYKLPLNYLDQFRMDGTSLCMLNENEFRQRSPIVGEYLYAQLDFWRSAYSLTSAPPSTSTTTSTTIGTVIIKQEPKVFTDLSPVTPNSSTSITSICQQPTLMFSSTAFTTPPPAHHTSSIYAQPLPRASTTATSSVRMSEALPLGIPKCVFTVPVSLSPASSVDSFDSSTSSLGSSPSYVSENDCQEMEVSSSVLPSSGNHRNAVTPTKQNIHLWQFLRELLLQPQHYGSSIRWLDRSKGIFKIEDSAHVARLWGQRKNRPAMNYDKLSRSIRQYYKKGIIKKTDNSKRLVYQFCPQYRV